MTAAELVDGLGLSGVTWPEAFVMGMLFACVAAVAVAWLLGER